MPNPTNAEIIEALQTELQNLDTLYDGVYESSEAIQALQKTIKSFNLTIRDWNTLVQYVNSHRSSLDGLLAYVKDLTTSLSEITDNISTELANKQDEITSSSINDGIVDKVIGFDAGGNMIKGTVASSTGCEEIANKVTSLSSGSTDTQYPSAKCVYDNLLNKADKVGTLPYYGPVNRSTNMYSFLTNTVGILNSSKPLILHDNTGNYYIGYFSFSGFSYTVELENLSSSRRYYGTNLDLRELTFNDFLSSTYQQDYAFDSALALKQDVLTFDNTPTNNSSNPVTSAGIYNAVQDVREVAEGKSNSFLVSSAITIATIKSYNSSIGGFYVYNATAGEFQDKKAELVAGDYDNITLANATIFGVSTASATSADYIVYQDNGSVPTATYYLVHLSDSLPIFKLGDNFYVLETDYPDRWLASVPTVSGVTKSFYTLETVKFTTATSSALGVVKLGNDTAIDSTAAKTYPVQLNASSQMYVSVPWTDTVGMSNPMNAANDIIVGGTSGAPTRLGAGTTGQVLKVGSSGLEWANESGGNGLEIITVNSSSQTLSQLKNSGVPYVMHYTASGADEYYMVRIKEINDGQLPTPTITYDYEIENLTSSNRYVAFGVSDLTFAQATGSSYSQSYMANPMTAQGDLIIGGSSGSPSRLGIGTNGQVLTSNGTTASWQNASGGSGTQFNTFTVSYADQRTTGTGMASILYIDSNGTLQVKVIGTGMIGTINNAILFTYLTNQSSSVSFSGTYTHLFGSSSDSEMMWLIQSNGFLTISAGGGSGD